MRTLIAIGAGVSVVRDYDDSNFSTSVLKEHIVQLMGYADRFLVSEDGVVTLEWKNERDKPLEVYDDIKFTRRRKLNKKEVAWIEHARKNTMYNRILRMQNVSPDFIRDLLA